MRATKSNTTGTAPGNTSPAAGGFKRSTTSGATSQSSGLPKLIFPPDSQRPCFCCYDTPFLVGNDRYKEGVYYHCMEEDTDAAGNRIDVQADHWILSVYKVLRIVRTDSNNEHSYLVLKEA